MLLSMHDGNSFDAANDEEIGFFFSRLAQIAKTIEKEVRSLFYLSMGMSVNLLSATAIECGATHYSNWYKLV